MAQTIFKKMGVHEIMRAYFLKAPSEILSRLLLISSSYPSHCIAFNLKSARNINIRVLLATVAGTITIFLLGYFIFGILLAPYTIAGEIEYTGLRKEPPDMLLLLLKNIVQAVLLVYIFEYLAGIRTFLGGVKEGAIIMFLITLSLNLSLLSIMNLHTGFTANILDVVGETVRAAVGGGVIGAILGFRHKGE